MLIFDKIFGQLYFGFMPPSYDGMQNFTRMRFLYDSVLHFAQCSSGIALEIGCFRGCSTVFLAKACLRKSIKEIYSIDLFTGTPSWGQSVDTYDTATERMKKYKLQNSVTLIRSHSLKYDWNKPIDVLHLDGDHEYEAVTADIGKYIPFINTGGIVIFDDYDPGHPGVQRAVHGLLGSNDEFEIVAVSNVQQYYGSICLRKRGLAEVSS